MLLTAKRVRDWVPLCLMTYYNAIKLSSHQVSVYVNNLLKLSFNDSRVLQISLFLQPRWEAGDRIIYEVIKIMARKSSERKQERMEILDSIRVPRDCYRCRSIFSTA